MTPDPTAEVISETAKPLPPSTAGMTTKVVKGSLWTLAGSVLPLAVAFISTPFVIRILGAESYGVLLLVGLIPTYFNFADFGMGIASTRFASEAYGEGNARKEAETVWTATTVAAITATIVAIPLFILSTPILARLNVPEHLLQEASIALKLTSAAFVCGVLAGVLNSPMLARLRMDLNIATSAAPKVMLAAITPVVLYFGGGIVGAVAWALVVGVVALAVVFFFSGRLLPALFRPKVNLAYLRPLLRFGGAWLLAMIAGILLVNFDKLALTRLVSVRALAYYSIAFTLANMATTFSSAMLQSLVPAFSQMLAPEKRADFDNLFTRGMRINLVLLLPAIAFLFVVAKPFFTIWAGEEFGRESSLPFYILLFGLFFNVLSYVPHSAITAKGRTDIFAKLYWLELAVYVAAAYILISRFGIAGAAAAWSVRVVIDALIIIWLSKRIAGASFDLALDTRNLIAAIAVLLPMVFVAAFYDNFSPWLLLIAPVSLGLYGVIVLAKLLAPEEKLWIQQRAAGMFRPMSSIIK